MENPFTFPVFIKSFQIVSLSTFIDNIQVPTGTSKPSSFALSFFGFLTIQPKKKTPSITSECSNVEFFGIDFKSLL
jgi:hypothetical protein